MYPPLRRTRRSELTNRAKETGRRDRGIKAEAARSKMTILSTIHIYLYTLEKMSLFYKAVIFLEQAFLIHFSIFDVVYHAPK